MNQSTAKAQYIEDQLSISFALIVLVFSICWTPLYITNAIFAINKNIHIPPGCFLAFVNLSCASSAINPMLYAYRMKDFRTSIKSIYRRLIFGERDYEVILQRQMSNTNCTSI
jgi:hypothetical protein